jgi:hypothetical protein
VNVFGSAVEVWMLVVGAIVVVVDVGNRTSAHLIRNVATDAVEAGTEVVLVSIKGTVGVLEVSCCLTTSAHRRISPWAPVVVAVVVAFGPDPTPALRPLETFRFPEWAIIT